MHQTRTHRAVTDSRDVVFTGFRDRSAAGRALAARLEHLRRQDRQDDHAKSLRDEVVVLGLPRGGVPVAYEVAMALGVPLDVIVVRKIGVPFQPELGMGAVGEGGVRVVNDEVVALARVSEAQFAAVERQERDEVVRRAQRFRAGRPPVAVAGRTAVIVDDGVATGSTARAACLVARALGAARVVLAVPVAPTHATRDFADVADEVIALYTGDFGAIGELYDDFSQVPDEQVAALLARTDPAVYDEEVSVLAGPVRLPGHLTVPSRATGVVAFAHGSGSSRTSPRNRLVATVLQQGGLGTLLFDLLTPTEEVSRAKVFDVELLANRLLDATAWLAAQPAARGLPIGYFGASTGAAAALLAAAESARSGQAATGDGGGIAAVVSRGGRPDLTGPRLSEVRAPTLLIVGGHDDQVLALNQAAQAQLRCENRLVVVPGATHLFEEPGTLAEVADLARSWFVDHLGTAAGS